MRPRGISTCSFGSNNNSISKEDSKWFMLVLTADMKFCKIFFRFPIPRTDEYFKANFRTCCSDLHSNTFADIESNIPRLQLYSSDCIIIIIRNITLMHIILYVCRRRKAQIRCRPTVWTCGEN